MIKMTSLQNGRRIIVLLVALCAFTFSIDAQNSPCTFPELSDFIRNCSIYITWPGYVANDKLKPFVLGVLGNRDEYKNLSQAIDANIKDKKIQVKYLESIESIDECQILYITKDAENKLPEILSFTKNKAILTIGRTKGFCEQGVHINLVTFTSPVVFEVNQNAILASGLKVSHILMFHAKVINR